MKLLIFGHSYVRDISNLGRLSFEVENTKVSVKYIYYPGAGYEKILNNPSILLDSLENYKPDILVTILGGNSITKYKSNTELFELCKCFYKLIRDNCPDLIIIPAQIELRFYSEENRFNSPTESDYRYQRNCLNKFLNRLKTKNHLLMIAGIGRLDHRVFYRDEVHLNKYGLTKYFDYIRYTVAYAIRSAK